MEALYQCDSQQQRVMNHLPSSHLSRAISAHWTVVCSAKSARVRPLVELLKLRYFGIYGFKANGLVHNSLGQRPRNKEYSWFLWPTAIFILDRTD